MGFIRGFGNLKKEAHYYDKHSVVDVGDISKMVVCPGKIKKISMGIPQNIYTKALGLSELFGVGYQDILKMAMLIGLSQLSEQIKGNH